MTDILTRLAAITEKDKSSPVPSCPFCNSLNGSERHDDGRCWWHCDACGATGPALSRYSEEDEPCWESRPREAALIALVQEAAGEIARLREGLNTALGCFNAAYAEGLHDRLAEVDDSEPGSLPGLVRRRLLYAIPTLEQALDPQEPTS